MRAKPENIPPHRCCTELTAEKLRASNLIILVESKIKHEIFNKKIDFLTIFKKEISRKTIISLLAI